MKKNKRRKARGGLHKFAIKRDSSRGLGGCFVGLIFLGFVPQVRGCGPPCPPKPWVPGEVSPGQNNWGPLNRCLFGGLVVSGKGVEEALGS